MVSNDIPSPVLYLNFLEANGWENPITLVRLLLLHMIRRASNTRDCSGPPKYTTFVESSMGLSLPMDGMGTQP